MKKQYNWENDINQGENVVLSFGTSEKYIKVSIALSIVLGLLLMYPFGEGIIIILGGLFFFGYHERRANNYALTNKRLIIHQGLIHKTTTSIEYSQITDIIISEPFFDRVMTGSGIISINTAGSSVTEVRLKHVENPQEIKKKIFELKNLNTSLNNTNQTVKTPPTDNKPVN